MNKNNRINNKPQVWAKKNKDSELPPATNPQPKAFDPQGNVVKNKGKNILNRPVESPLLWNLSPEDTKTWDQMNKIMNAFESNDSAVLKDELICLYQQDRRVQALMNKNDLTADKLEHNAVLNRLEELKVIDKYLYYLYMSKLAFLISKKDFVYKKAECHSNQKFNVVAKEDEDFFYTYGIPKYVTMMEDGAQVFYQILQDHARLIRDEAEKDPSKKMSPEQRAYLKCEYKPVVIQLENPDVPMKFFLDPIIRRAIFPVILSMSEKNNADGAKELSPFAFKGHDEAHLFSTFLTAKEARLLEPVLNLIEERIANPGDDLKAADTFITWGEAALFFMCHETEGLDRDPELKLLSLEQVLKFYSGQLVQKPKYFFSEYISLESYIPIFVKTRFLTEKEADDIRTKYKDTPMTRCPDLARTRTLLVAAFATKLLKMNGK